jgi:hypothetical protein
MKKKVSYGIIGVFLAIFLYLVMTQPRDSYVNDAKVMSDVKHLQAAIELFKDSCGGYPSVGELINVELPFMDYNVGCPTGVTLGSFIDKNHIPKHTYRSGWLKRSKITEPYKYCSVVSDDSATCTESRKSYKIPFSLEGQVGLLTTGQHEAAPKEIR